MGALLAVVGATAIAAVVVVRPTHHRQPPGCRATAASGSYGLDLEQAANAATIAAIGKRAGLPDHAVTVALAAALLESRLHNLSSGDRDSVGLFQQRPSQGWGSPAQLHTPSYAAAAFYRGLEKVRGWATLPVTDAAQRVQRSAAPLEYAEWEGEARVLAQALTGEVAGGLVCRFQNPPAVTASQSLPTAMAAEVGSPGLGVAVTEARGWTVAEWLVGHAYEYGITVVDFGGRRWTPASSTWGPAPVSSLQVEMQQTAVPG
jgi:hypothetical protein